jgi:hypothetical protein
MDVKCLNDGKTMAETFTGYYCFWCRKFESKEQVKERMINVGTIQ